MAASVFRSRRRNGESGVTLAIVALTLVALLGMAALAIDLVNLYVARGETQRAADAAALAGAKALVDYGATSGDTSLQPAAQTYATAMATAAAQQNLIVGQSVPSANVAVTFPNAGKTSTFAINPQVQVRVTRTGLPSFFAKIWAAGSSTTVATALAEGYNPSNAASLPGVAPLPVAARCVKPWLLSNMDPGNASQPFFNVVTGDITRKGLVPGGEIGEPIQLSLGCSPNCAPQPSLPVAGVYYPLQLDPGTAYANSIDGCVLQPIACGSTVALDTADASYDPNGNATNALINASGSGIGNGQDAINTGTAPFQISAGDNNPLVPAQVADGSVLSTSSSVVTIPVFDSAPGRPTNPVAVIGFIQGFVDTVNPVTKQPHIVILNVSGCGAAAGTPIAGGGGTAVPVRLIR